MKILALTITLGVSALAVAACMRPMAFHHRALEPISQLSCPDSQGQFSRKSVAPDGKSCDYAGADGSELQLKLVSFTGDADAALDPIEIQMKALLPPPVPSAPPPSDAPTAPHGTDHDNVNINLPGISIHADDKNANVHVGGVHIDADDNTHSVKINGGGQGPMGHRGQFTVDANDNGAVVRARAFDPHNVEQSLILASKTPGPDGWRTVAYEAVGPKSGPLVIANFRSKSEDHDMVFDDVKALAWKAARKG